MNEEERRCLEDIKGMLKNYGKLVFDLSKMDSAELQELDINEGMSLIGAGIWIVLNRFYDVEVKKAKSDGK